MRRMIPGRVVVKTKPGWELEHVAAYRDAKAGVHAAALSLDGGEIDRALEHYTPAFLATRTFTSKTQHWDRLERELGLDRTFRVVLDPLAKPHDVARALLDLDHVESASPEYLCEAPDAPPMHAAPNHAPLPARATLDRAREIIGAEEAMELEQGDAALIIALIDSGVDVGHPELSGRLRPGMSSVALPKERLADGTVVLTGAHKRYQDVDDDAGHGTSCAAIISAIGYLIPPGLAGLAHLLPVRSLCGARIPGRSKLTALGSIEDINAGLKFAIDSGARVLNLSFGTAAEEIGPDDPVPHVEMIRYGLAHDCVMVAASGNTGKAGDLFPAVLPGVLAVGSVDGDRRPSSFTTRGEHVALCAPGERVASAAIDGNYTFSSGTSFAAPLVASACALLLARAARYSTPLAPSSVRELLIKSASPFARGVDAAGCGAGILDIPAVLRALDAACEEAVA